MTGMDSAGFNQLLNQLLKMGTYRSREVFKLRSGVGDGYVYTFEEIGAVLKVIPPVVGELFDKGIYSLCERLAERLPSPPVSEVAASISRFASSFEATKCEDLRRLVLDEYQKLWSEFAATQQLGTQRIGWSPELQAEILTFELRGNPHLDAVLMAALQRNADAIQATFVGSPMALAISTIRDGFPILRTFCWSRLPESPPAVRYFSIVVEDEERTTNWLRDRGFNEYNGFSLVDRRL